MEIRVVQSEIAVNMTLATQDIVRMGVKARDARYFKGRITAFHVYDAALTAKQINTMKNAGLVAPDPPFNVTVDSKSSRVVNISWMAGFDGMQHFWATQ
ncbi:hypothetical protein OS493_008547 [Desmophyllum pertusum]|uniref:Uncharacterized protein n=1 Tax=Desmophyllum pertusum TaxID=174260 RepID=A0A9W9ZSW7_9CNID|nr:hypothetical protein OS493_008547 [Desmophyllum pertusum]